MAQCFVVCRWYRGFKLAKERISLMHLGLNCHLGIYYLLGKLDSLSELI